MPASPWVPVVGIGASAGGLEAFTRFFRSMPDRPGIAFVLVMHLDPTHESMMAELLGKHTSMSVSQAEEGMSVEIDHVYIIPPSKQITIKDGTLHLAPPIERRGLRMPIDRFFSSLAQDQGERAIAIVLSGTGSDGTQGIKEVKNKGGLILVQEPTEAKHDGMPRSVIATGMADHVMSVDSMPKFLRRYVRHPYMHNAATNPEGLVPAGTEVGLRDILVLLRSKTRLDFRPYKPATIARRIERRMGLASIDTIEAYHRFLQEDPNEAQLLVKDFLIGVTRFFRDQNAFQILEEEAIPQLVARKQIEEPIRVWVPGCSLGHEAYGLAMLFIEAIERARKRCPLQIFATDVDQSALADARNGVYGEDIVEDVTPERLRRFFIQHDQSYQIVRRLRDCVTFAPQNLISDPPFSKLDLVSCRNVLIYLDNTAQDRAISLFHFALREGGILFLGSSENLGKKATLFETVSKKWRIYRRLPRRLDDIDVSSQYEPFSRVPQLDPLVTQGLEIPYQRRRLPQIAQEVLLDRLVPPTVLVDRELSIRYYHGATERYLVHPRGEPSTDLFSVAKRGLKSKLQQITRKAITEGTTSEARAIVHDGDDTRHVALTAIPLKEPRELEGLVLITFQDAPVDENASPASAPELYRDLATLELEDELKNTREQLSVTIEELEAANEELKASNEEVMSMNEELQATNEELETVNTQLEAKVEELTGLTNDLGNLLASTQIATVFLDTSFKIKRFTPTARRLFNLIIGDIGRPLGNITHNLVDPNLLLHAEKVISELMPIEEEVQDRSGNTYVRRVTPYRTEDNRIEGVVLTFVDITTRKAMEAELDKHRRNLEKLVAERTTELAMSNDQLSQQILVREQVEQNLRARALEATLALEGSRGGLWSIDFPRDTGASSAIPDALFIAPELKNLIGYDDNELANSRTAWFARIHPDDLANIDEASKAHLAGRTPIYEVEYRIRHKDGTERWIYSRGKILRDAHGKPIHWAGIDWDITERKRSEEDEQRRRAILEEEVSARTAELRQEIAERSRAESALRQSEELFRLLTVNAPVGIFRTDIEGNITFANRHFCEIVGASSPELVVGKPWTNQIVEADLPSIESSWESRAEETGRFSCEFRYHVGDDGLTWVYGSIVPLHDDRGHAGYLGTCIDITERKAVDEHRKRLEMQIQHAQKLESLGVLAGGIAHDFNNLLVSILGNAQLAEDELAPESGAREPLRDIETGARRAADLCRQLLAYSGKGRFVVQPLDLGRVVEEMTHLLEVSISKKATLRYELAPSLPPIEADATQVQQIVMNLIMNASEAIGERNGTITVRTGGMDCDAEYLKSSYVDDELAAGRYVYLEVADTGTGLDEETRARMFDPFYTTKFTGRGLGLAAVLGIVRGHRAAIRVESAKGRGTTFRVLFPASDKPMRNLRAEAATRIEHGHGTVLVVDDEPSVIKVLKRTLGRMGLVVHAANNGAEALVLFQEHAASIDCVLLDLTMPDIDGDELFQSIRRIRAGTPVFMMSGYSEQEISRRFLGQGLAGFLQKPFDLPALRAAIGEVVGLSTGKR